MPLGEVLIKKGLLTQPQLDQALTAQKDRPGTRIGDILIELGFITKSQLEEALR